MCACPGVPRILVLLLRPLPYPLPASHMVFWAKARGLVAPRVTHARDGHVGRGAAVRVDEQQAHATLPRGGRARAWRAVRIGAHPRAEVAGWPALVLIGRDLEVIVRERVGVTCVGGCSICIRCVLG